MRRTSWKIICCSKPMFIQPQNQLKFPKLKSKSEQKEMARKKKQVECVFVLCLPPDNESLAGGKRT